MTASAFHPCSCAGASILSGRKLSRRVVVWFNLGDDAHIIGEGRQDKWARWLLPLILVYCLLGALLLIPPVLLAWKGQGGPEPLEALLDKGGGIAYLAARYDGQALLSAVKREGVKP